jgi:guanine deaminase
LFIVKGNIAFTKTSDYLTIIENGYIGVKDGMVLFVSSILPKEYEKSDIVDYGDKLIIPGFCDLHAHAPQFENIGLGMNMKLLPWLKSLTFPTEAKYQDVDYAKKMYARVVNDLYRFGTTRAVLFSSVHVESTQLLLDMMTKAGLKGYVGKVNMDDNCPDFLIEDTQKSLEDTRMFFENNRGDIPVKPILTPRFVPSCTEAMMRGLGEIAREYNAPIQSHINENLDEIKWVAYLYPESKHYADVYDGFNLLNEKTLMAHCIHMSDEETELFIERGVYAVHCPHSNCNISSGMMPLKILMGKGMKAGIGSDVSGGHAVSIPKSIVLAMQIAKLRYQANPEEGFLKLSEALYLATKGGGSFFGKVGSFEEGYEFDALVIDDDNLKVRDDLTTEQRLEKYIYIGDDRNIIHRYVYGKKLEKPKFD